MPDLEKMLKADLIAMIEDMQSKPQEGAGLIPVDEMKQLRFVNKNGRVFYLEAQKPGIYHLRVLPLKE